MPQPPTDAEKVTSAMCRTVLEKLERQEAILEDLKLTLHDRAQGHHENLHTLIKGHHDAMKGHHDAMAEKAKHHHDTMHALLQRNHDSLHSLLMSPTAFPSLGLTPQSSRKTLEFQEQFKNLKDGGSSQTLPENNGTQNGTYDQQGEHSGHLERCKSLYESLAANVKQKPLQGTRDFLVNLMMGTAFESFASVVIIANIWVTFLELQYEGRNQAYKAGFREDDGGWPDVKSSFHIAEYVFTCFYLVETALRTWALGRQAFSTMLNVMDIIIVAMSCLDVLVLQPLGAIRDTISVSALRILKVLRIFRTVKLVAFADHATSDIRILVRTLGSSLRVVVWSVFLIGAILVVAGIIMVQLSFGFIVDPAITETRREWLFNSFGTAARATYSMFECTFSGAWVQYSKPMVHEVHSAFTFFWIMYIVLINFTMMRVVAALFLKNTMAVAQVDEERQAMEKMRQKQKFARELEAIFKNADTSGDGSISADEFGVMLQDGDIMKRFKALGLEVDEVIALFSVCCEGDDGADYEEFLRGTLKMKSSARTIDTMQLFHGQLRLHRLLEDISTRIGREDTS